MLDLDIKIKVSFMSQIQKKCFFPSVHFSNDLKLNVSIELYPHIGEIHTEMLVYEKAGVIKHIKALAINKFELLNL